MIRSTDKMWWVKWWGPILGAAAVGAASTVGGVGAVILVDRAGSLDLPLALLLLLVPVVVLLCWFKFDWMMGAAVAMSSVVLIEPAPVDLLLVLLLVIGLLKGDLSLRQLRRPLPLHLGVWLLIITNLSALIRPDPRVSSLIFAAVSVYLLILMYLFKMYVTNIDRARILFVGYWAAGGIAIASVAAAYLGVPGSQFLLYAGLRAKGLFKDPNVFGPFLVPLFLLILDEWIDPVLVKVAAWIKGLSLVLLLVGILFSFSRAAWANLALSAVVYAGFKLLAKKHVGRLVAVLVQAAIVTLLLAAVLFVVRPELARLFSWRLTLVERYDAFRFTRHEEGLVTALLNPLGIGPGMFGGAHQLYIKTWAEQGFLGFAGLVIVLVTVNREGLKAVLRAKTMGLSAPALLAGLVGTLTNGFLIDAIHWRHLYLLLGLVWAVSAVQVDGAASCDDSRRTRYSSTCAGHRCPSDTGAG